MRRLLHFGPGNFFRAHLAEYLFDAGGWEIDVVSLRSSLLTDGLAAQGGAYTLVVQGQGARRIEVIRDAEHAPRDPAAVLDRIADARVEVISATVTEKGYHLGADGQLNLADDAIAEELVKGQPSTLIGFLAYGLSTRVAPVSVLSCDNRSQNGQLLEQAVHRFAQAAGLRISCEATFPNAMVDRITPATTEALRAQTGDPLAVPCEPFKEWVIADNWSVPRPDWPGVQWVSDVAPHEMRKLRMLNGAHSYLAYAGCLAGHEFVHQAIADPVLRAGVQQFMAEAAETLPDPVRLQAPAYAEALIKRFENPHLHHALRQIAMDGTQKLPYRVVQALRARSADASPGHRAVLRAWIAFCRSETQAGRALQDPQAKALAKAQTDADFLRLIGAEGLTLE